MIVTVTMNPALDKTAQLKQLIPGALNRLERVRIDAGGKGVNVSRMIRALGGQSVCAGFAAGASGRDLCQRIELLGVRQKFLFLDGATRTNLKIVDANGMLTELNEPGITASEEDLSALLEQVIELAGVGGIVVLSGSLPQGAGHDTYHRFIKALKQTGCTVLLDADADAFRFALDARPHVIKPNRYELLQYYGLPSDTADSELPDLCQGILDKGVEWLVLSLGSDGAMFFTPKQRVRANTLPLTVRSTVGAGDSMVGALAFALERGLPFEDTVRLAMASSNGAVTTEGTNPPAKELVNELANQIVLKPI